MEALLRVVDRVYKVTITIIKVFLLALWTMCFFICNELGIIAAIIGIVVLLIMSLF